ncbi:MAG TPA: deoxyribose-phosphate aldolase [Gemmatimonadales bacterium]|nr:deoxyribose-phosphate aldolase [Gemmatimonadales bacterium]
MNCTADAEVISFAKLFDHSIVRPDATRDQVRQFAQAAATLGTATLTVQPHYIGLAAELLHGSGVLVGTVVGFPHGNETPTMKERQAKEVLSLGAEEIDMVMNIPALKNGEKELFLQDVEGVVGAAAGFKVKVITENCYLTQAEKRCACEWIAQAGAHFVKTSTAYADGGATLDDVRLMYEVVRGRCLVKAAGGIRQLAEVLEYLKAGARRFGSTRSDQFVRAFQALPPHERASFAEYLPRMPEVGVRLRGGTNEPHGEGSARNRDSDQHRSSRRVDR